MDYKEKTSRVLSLIRQRTTRKPTKKSLDPRFENVDGLPWDIMFSTFNEKHLQEASQVFKILHGAVDFDDFINLAGDVRILENDDLFMYALYTAVLHRDDCRGVILPPIEECAPHWFFAAETIHEAIQLSIHEPKEDHVVVNQRTAESIEPESRLSYFREDIGLNTHHWSWHVVFPVVWDENATGIIKDRKGELFFYMHEQMLARYDCERLSNGLNRVTPLLNFREKLLGYAPHLTSQITGVHFGARPKGLFMRDTPTTTVQDLELWRSRIFDAVDNGIVHEANGQEISLDNTTGIDILGAIVESSSFSVNRSFYGNLHNLGHTVMAAVHDPDGRFREYPGVMGFIETAARDPVFYRWHKFIDVIFQRHKATLVPYTNEELSFEGIKIESIEVIAKEKNVMETFMKERQSDLSHAPFLKTKRNIWVKYEYMDHEPFSYVINIENQTEETKHATIRIFIGPKFDESGNLYGINEQRTLMIELDKFQKELAPGNNAVSRHASQSSVTLLQRIPTFRRLLSGDYEATVDYCTCGWPDNLLIPKGTPKGLDFVLFVMCTDYADDKPEQEPRINVCGDASSYCGSKDQKYPDRKPMGFPFDRRILNRNFEQFLTDNMTLTDVKIKHVGAMPQYTEWTVNMIET